MATKSTPTTSASIIRLTALTPAPPTPMTRNCGAPTGDTEGAKYGSGAGGGSGSGRALIMFSGRSEENAWRSRSCGVGTRRGGTGPVTEEGVPGRGPSGGVTGGCAVRCGASVPPVAALRRRGAVSSPAWARGSSPVPGSRALRAAADGAPPAAVPLRERDAGAPVPSAAGVSGSTPPSAGTSSSSVFRKSAASGPSRMLARLPLLIREHLLRQLAIGIGRRAVGVVLEHGHPLHGSLREPDRLPDARAEQLVPEVLLEDLDRLLGVERPGVDHRRQDPGDVDVRIEVLADHGKRVLQLDEAPHRQILALDRDDDLVGRGQCVDGQ